MARNRIRVKGLWAGSTSDYGSIVDAYEPVLSLNKKDEQFEMLDKMGNVIYMTRQEFEEHNIFINIAKSLKDYYPNDSVMKFSKKYKAVSKLLHSYVELYTNRKALREQSLTLNVA